jgi:hypothetical protein
MAQLQGLSMSSSDRTRNHTTAPPRQDAPAASPSVPPTDPYANWLDRMQRARARHAAITKNLHTWSNYKNWADQMKDSWTDEDQNEDKSK